MDNLIMLNSKLITKTNLSELEIWYLLLLHRQKKYRLSKTKKIESEIDFIQKQIIRLTKYTLPL